MSVPQRLVLLALALHAAISGAAPVTLPIPPRPAGAPTGSEFVALVTDLSRDDREMAVCDAVSTGNIPDFQRTLVPVTTTRTISGTPHTATYHVIPDYLAIGSNDDYFLCPLTPLMAQQIADMLQCHLPTRRMVDQIWAAAPLHLNPQPIAPSADMITVPVFNTHNTMVYGQRDDHFATAPLGTLVAGDKKDVVVSPKLWDGTYTDFARVAIYGWHYTSGTAIQPLYFGHESTYADYSHGIRLVLNAMTVDGAATTVENVLRSPTLTTLLNDELSGSNPYVFGARTRYIYTPLEHLPFTDLFPSTGRQLSSWDDRFTGTSVLAFSPTSPGGDGYVMRVQDASGGVNTARIPRSYLSDYTVQADLYCEYRPALAADGYERIGLFVRDDGNGMFEGTNGAATIKGNNYSLCWDSNTGAIHCFRTVNGVPTELLPAPAAQASSAWRHFRIDALGSQIGFYLDGSLLVSVTDSTFPRGQFGVGFHEYFTTNSNLHGTRADNFNAALAVPLPVGMSLLGSL